MPMSVRMKRGAAGERGEPMLQRETGKVIEVWRRSQEIELIRVETDERIEEGINYPSITGAVREGDEVLLNTTAVRLTLGSGGFHIVMAILNRNEKERNAPSGHIMKGRYTPFQLAVQCVEEEEHPLYSPETRGGDLQGFPILLFSLHSMLPASLLFIQKKKPNLKAVYIMTDGTALPIWLSNHVRSLKEEGLLYKTITAGQAFGGDLESVNVYSAMLAARYSLGADVILVGPGPGSVGTAHPFGYSAVETGELINAVAALNGTGIVVPRIQFQDPRPRHRGLSHHLLTSLSRIALAPAYLPIPLFAGEEKEWIKEQIEHYRLGEKHHLLWRPLEKWDGLVSMIEEYPIETMGRGILEDPPFLQGIAVASSFFLSILK